MGWFDDASEQSRSDEEREYLDLVRVWAPRLADLGISPGNTGVFPLLASVTLEVEVPLPHPGRHNLHVGLLTGSRLVAEPSFDGYILDGAIGPWTLALDATTPADAAEATAAWLEKVLTAELHVEQVAGRPAVRVLVGESAAPVFQHGWWWPWQKPERRRLR